MLESETDWIDKFIRHLEFERRLSALTCKHYRRDLQALSEYCAKNDLRTWGQVDDDHLRSVSAQWFRRGLAPRSIQRRLSAIRMFFRFLVREKHVKKNPVQTVRAPKAGKRLPENLDADRMAKLLDIPGEGPLVARDRAILELLYSSGLRLAELTDLNLGDVDMADCTVRVTGKGNKDRIVPVGRHAIRALRTWHTERALMAATEERALFVSNRGSRLSQRSVQARVDHWAKRQGINTKVYPHLFRHSFASHLLESSHDLRAVQELLGHSNISTTQVYTHLDFQHLAQIYDKTHPRARLKDKS
ncbi:MAG: tyrosine recombinase XerC [Gammaproteobacteria bacterium]|nr:MAG: tyrosine recombinase XerC [Gammaproteobacteria bacterium]RLA35532.1 MAG: tyrosine recombinase XerC [Gammaproteobacteria bacterium]